MASTTRAVILDLDGTLVDHVGSVIAALERWLPTLGVDASGELVAAWFAAEDRHYPDWLAGLVSHPEQRRRRLREFLPLVGHTPGADDDLDQVFAGYLTHYRSSWVAFADVEPALEALTDAGLALAVLTNGTTEQQHAKLEAVGLSGRVGPVFTAEQLGAAKPDPSTYLTVCAALGVTPDATVHVGDQHDVDVVAPRTNGLRAVHLDRTDTGPHDEPLRITSLTQLHPLLDDT